VPVQTFYKDKVYTEIEVQKPKASTIAEASSLMKDNKIYSGLAMFLKGSCISMSTEDSVVEDSVSIKSLIPKMPYRSAEFSMIQIMTKQYENQDGVEGIYPCPLCGYKIISQLKKTDDLEIDTRDFISTLDVNYKDDDSPTFKVDLVDPIKIKDKRDGSIIEEVCEIEMYYPTLEHCMNAEAKYGHNNSLKLQFGIYANSLKAVNGQDVDNKYRNMVGITIFENISNLEHDFRALSDENSKYGVDPRIEKICPECNKVWRPQINTSNFFVSALRLN